jgi:hypothetical protein
MGLREENPEGAVMSHGCQTSAATDNASLEIIGYESKGKGTNEIPWYDAVDRMDSSVKGLSKVAKKLGDAPEAKEILAVIERVGDLHQQFVRVFDVVHDELMDAESGLGCLIKSMPKLDAGDLPPNELACLLGPLFKRLAEATSLLGMLARG